MKSFLAAIVLAGAFVPAALAASHAGAAAKPAAEGPFAEAEVRKVDKDAGKITLKHGPIANLDMPAMSMVFRAKDPAMLDKVKAGAKVTAASGPPAA